ncbi:ADP-ribosylation factor-like protein 9 isoform X2 [Brachyhypopomus gauderio]|uniref:ADP-ribosylation factor-like protein 9 isoform X2 n=1 Tax=Brachyhypopomus gauderio TaxID=698409 RepID=UPI0040436DC7
MPGVREVLVVGAAALAGAAAFVIWRSVNAEKEEPEPARAPVGAEKCDRPAEEDVGTEPGRQAASAAEQQVSGTQVLVLGLEGAGKTSLLHCFTTGNLEQDVTPTQGFNAVSINREGLHIEFLEIGGGEKVRGYWQMYLSRARVLVFVVDSADAARFPLAKTHLHQLLAADPYLPLVVLANKQDLPRACGVAELYEALELGSVGDGRKLYVLVTQVKDRAETNTSVQDAHELILELMKNNHSSQQCST